MHMHDQTCCRTYNTQIESRILPGSTLNNFKLFDNVMGDITCRYSPKLMVQPINASLRPSKAADASVLHTRHDSGSQEQSKFKTCLNNSTVFSDCQADARQQMQKTGLVRGGARFSIYAAVADDTCRHVRCNCMGFDGTTPGVCTVSRHPKTSYRAVVIGALSDDDNDNNNNDDDDKYENYNILLMIQDTAVTQTNLINPNEFYSLTVSFKYDDLIIVLMTISSTTVHDACPVTSMPIIVITFVCP